MVHHGDFHRDHADGVAIGRRRRDGGMADDARAAGAVHDVEGLAEILLEDGRDDARRRIRAAARAPGADQRHGTVRPFRLGDAPGWRSGPQRRLPPRP